ncbi:MAG: WG repeat-containing protein [Chitinophagaceae bacterium]|nr:WG repeat-containing protein [Chitinophagaceae bacterium]
MIGGYKNAQGKIIIPAKYILYEGDEMTSPDCQYVYVLQAQTSNKPVLNSEACKVFNKQGKLLYAAYWFDNGPDYFQEGMRRYVENGKVGFVDYFGNKIIKATWDDASAFYNGLAKVGKNCNVSNLVDEHYIVSCSDYFLIDREGKIITKIENEMNIDSIGLLQKERIVNKPLLAQEVEYEIQHLQEVKLKIDSNEIEKEALFFITKDATQKNCWLFIFRTKDELYESEFKFLYYLDSKSLFQLNDCGNKFKIKFDIK